MNLKRTIYLFAIFTFAGECLFARPTARQEKNLTAFCKLYGYIRFFHPSDEAQKVYWEKFAIYGANEVVNMPSDEALIKKLNTLFLPLAPSMKLDDTKNQASFKQNRNDVIKPGANPIYWQHEGVKLPEFNTVYKSMRVNRRNESWEDPQFIPLFVVKESQNLAGKIFTFKVSMRGDTTLNKPSLIITNPRNSDNFKTEALSNLSESYIGRQEKIYTFKGQIAGDSNMVIGLTFDGKSPVSINHTQLFVDIDGKQIEQTNAISNNGNTSTRIPDSKRSINIETIKNDAPLFVRHPLMGEAITKEIVSGVTCSIPLVVAGNNSQTFPAGDTLLLKQLNHAIEKKIPNKSGGESRGQLLEFRLGDVIITWNVWKHFYPYWKDANLSADSLLHESLKRAFADKTALDFFHTLTWMGAQLNDGHVFTSFFDQSNLDNEASVPIVLKKAEGKVIVQFVLNGDLETVLLPGDVIDSIDHRPAASFLTERENAISGSPQWKEQKALFILTNGPKNNMLEISAVNHGKATKLKIKRTLPGVEYRKGCFNPAPKFSGEINQNVFYFNLTEDSIGKKLDQLEDKFQHAKAIIFDMRGYPSEDIYPVISHLISNPVKSTFFHIPQLIYPDFNRSEYKTDTMTINPANKKYSGKIYFLTDASAMSYAESFLGLVKDFKLGTLVGTATAGTNGNINYISLPGGYRTSFSGMRVTNNDGSPNHLKGIVPDIWVNSTVKGIEGGRDEILEQAIREAVK